MGLTIRYKMTPQPDWSWRDIRRRLVSIGSDIKAHCDFAEVEEVQEFRRVRLAQPPRDRWETEYWRRHHARRRLQIPESAHYWFSQEAKRGLILATWPGQGADQCNIGCAEYPSTLRHPWSLWIDWRQVLDNPKQYPVAVKKFRAFAAKHRFRIVQAKTACWRWYERYWPGRSIASIGSACVLEYSEKPDWRRLLAIVWPPYKHAPVLMLADDTEVEYTTEMRKDLERLHGRGTYRVDKTREWQSFCKTQQASNPNFGGVRNFLRVHRGVCAALKICEEHGFVVEVNDGAGFWGNWNTEALIWRIGASREEIESLSGVF